LNATTFNEQCSHDAVVGTITNTTPIQQPKPKEGRMSEKNKTAHFGKQLLCAGRIISTNFNLKPK